MFILAIEFALPSFHQCIARLDLEDRLSLSIYPPSQNLNKPLYFHRVHCIILLMIHHDRTVVVNYAFRPNLVEQLQLFRTPRYPLSDRS